MKSRSNAPRQKNVEWKNIGVPAGLYRKMESLARADGRSTSFFVQRILEAFVTQRVTN